MKPMAMLAAVIALLATGLLAPPVDAATMATAPIGSSYGEARILVGTSTRLSIAAKNLRARTVYTVALRRGNCSTVGALVASKRMTTSSYGKITTSFALTTSQARLVKLPMSIRVGTRCGSFKAPVVPPPPLELRAAVAAGKVVVSGRGMNLQRLEITLASQVAQPLRLVIEPATVFRPSAAATQSMTSLAAQVSRSPRWRAGRSPWTSRAPRCTSTRRGPATSSGWTRRRARPPSWRCSESPTRDLTPRVSSSRSGRSPTTRPGRVRPSGLHLHGDRVRPSDEEIAVIKQLFVKADSIRASIRRSPDAGSAQTRGPRSRSPGPRRAEPALPWSAPRCCRSRFHPAFERRQM